MKKDKDIILFFDWKDGNKYSVFSNWHVFDFKVDDTEYTSMEQYMMSEKAKFFKDKVSYEKIMAEKDPESIKKLGRLVDNFDSAKWDKVKCPIIVKGLIGKCNSCPRLKNDLLDTGDSVIAEAFKDDKIWAIGLSIDDPDAYDMSKWKGKNLMGKCLMEARSLIKPSST